MAGSAITGVGALDFGSLTALTTVRRVPGRRSPMKDIHEVLRRKKAQLEVLGKQIAQLQDAAEELRSIAHLLQDEDHEQAHAAGR